MNLVPKLAELALECDEHTFHQQFIETASAAIGAMGGSYITGRSLGSGDVASNLCDSSEFAEAVPTFVRQATDVEVAAMLTGRTVRHDSVFDSKRLDQLHMFREHLRLDRSKKTVIRSWLGEGTLHMFVFVAPKTETLDRFADRALPLLDQAFPVVRIASRLYSRALQCSDEPLSRENSGELGLSDAEHGTMSLVMRGLTNKEVAQLTGVSVNTIRNRLAVCFRKLNVSTRTEAVFVLTEMKREHSHSKTSALATYRAVVDAICNRMPEGLAERRALRSGRAAITRFLAQKK